MTWTQEVQDNRVAVLRANGAKPTNPSLLPPRCPPPANSGLVPIALVTTLLGGLVYWSREKHKLRGRRLPSWLEKWRRMLLAGSPRRPGAADAPRATPSQHQADDWRRQGPRALAAAAAEQRLLQQQQQQQQVRRQSSCRRFQAGACGFGLAVFMVYAPLIDPAQQRRQLISAVFAARTSLRRHYRHRRARHPAQAVLRTRRRRRSSRTRRGVERRMQTGTRPIVAFWPFSVTVGGGGTLSQQEQHGPCKPKSQVT